MDFRKYSRESEAVAVFQPAYAAVPFCRKAVAALEQCVVAPAAGPSASPLSASRYGGNWLPPRCRGKMAAPVLRAAKACRRSGQKACQARCANTAICRRSARISRRWKRPQCALLPCLQQQALAALRLAYAARRGTVLSHCRAWCVLVDETVPVGTRRCNGAKVTVCRLPPAWKSAGRRPNGGRAFAVRVPARRHSPPPPRARLSPQQAAWPQACRNMEDLSVRCCGGGIPGIWSLLRAYAAFWPVTGKYPAGDFTLQEWSIEAPQKPTRTAGLVDPQGTLVFVRCR